MNEQQHTNGLRTKSSNRQLVNYIHHRHLFLLSPKAYTHFTVLRGGGEKEPDHESKQTNSIGDGGREARASPKFWKIFFKQLSCKFQALSGKYVKFGHFVNFHTYIFGPKYLAPKVD